MLKNSCISHSFKNQLKTVVFQTKYDINKKNFKIDGFFEI